MSLEAFTQSEPLTLGVELELQLVNTHDYDLAPYAEDMLRLMLKTPLPGSVVPEMTNSMIEISTGICHSSSEVLGAVIATVAIYRAGESSKPWAPLTRSGAGERHEP